MRLTCGSGNLSLPRTCQVSVVSLEQPLDELPYLAVTIGCGPGIVIDVIAVWSDMLLFQ